MQKIIKSKKGMRKFEEEDELKKWNMSYFVQSL